VLALLISLSKLALPSTPAGRTGKTSHSMVWGLVSQACHSTEMRVCAPCSQGLRSHSKARVGSEGKESAHSCVLERHRKLGSVGVTLGYRPHSPLTLTTYFTM
jgi:hypothetical protein